MAMSNSNVNIAFPTSNTVDSDYDQLRLTSAV